MLDAAGCPFADLLPTDELTSSAGESSSFERVLAAHTSGQPEGESLQADAPDLVAFAKALAASGAKFYGAAWCPRCTDQKALFEDGGEYLPFIEVTNPDRTKMQIAIDLQITGYPTWEFADGSRLLGTQTLEALSLQSGIPIPRGSQPSFAPIANVTVPAGAPVWIPLNGYDPNGDPLRYTVEIDDPSVVAAAIPAGNRSLIVAVKNFGPMRFQLFDQLVPAITNHVATLAQQGFYNSTTSLANTVEQISQVGDNSWIRIGAAGTPASSPLGPVDDSFHFDLTHTSTGLLSLVRTTDDGGDYRFAITGSSQRSADFEQSIFGVLTEGNANRAAVNATALTNGAPTRAITINSVSVEEDHENGVLMLRGVASGHTRVRIRVDDGQGHTDEQTVEVTVQPDSANGHPILGPVVSGVFPVNCAGILRLTGADPEGDSVRYFAEVQDDSGAQVSLNPVTGQVIVTPRDGMAGEARLRVGVRPQDADPEDTSLWDTQFVTVQFTTDRPAWRNLENAADIDGDAVLAPRDVLLIVNELNSPEVCGSTGQLPSERDAAHKLKGYFDANGDSFVSPSDALWVINAINAATSDLASAQGEGQPTPEGVDWLFAAWAAQRRDAGILDDGP